MPSSRRGWPGPAAPSSGRRTPSAGERWSSRAHLLKPGTDLFELVLTLGQEVADVTHVGVDLRRAADVDQVAFGLGDAVEQVFLILGRQGNHQNGSHSPSGMGLAPSATAS